MRIVEVINSLTYRGGAQSFVISISKALSNMGHDVIVISLYGNIDQSYVDPNDKFKIITVNKRNSFDVLSGKRLKKEILKFNPDVVHCHLSVIPTYFFGFGFKKQKWALVQTLHSIPGYTVGKFENKLRFKYIKKGQIKMVAISKMLGDYMKEMYKVEPTYVDNGIVHIPHENKNIIGRKNDLIIVANNDENKNHKLLINCVKKLNDDGIFCNCVCLGGGELLEANKQLTRELGIEEKISFVGPVSNVGDYLNDSKIFVLASKKEGNPMSLLEAFDYGLCAVLPRTGGIPDLVEEGVNALLFDVDSLDGMYSALKSLLLDDSLIERMSSNNLEQSKKYSIESCAEKYLKIFGDKNYEKEN